MIVLAFFEPGEMLERLLVEAESPCPPGEADEAERRVLVVSRQGRTSGGQGVGRLQE